MDEGRVSKVKEYIQQSADIEKQTLPIVNICIDGMYSASALVDPIKVGV